MNLFPFGNRVIVKKDKPREEATQAGVIIPETTSEPLASGTVVGVGEGQILDSGVPIPIKITKGDKILFPRKDGARISPLFFGITPEDAAMLYTAEIIVLDASSIVAVMREPTVKEAVNATRNEAQKGS